MKYHFNLMQLYLIKDFILLCKIEQLITVPELDGPMPQGNFYLIEQISSVPPRPFYNHQLKTMPNPGNQINCLVQSIRIIPRRKYIIMYQTPISLRSGKYETHQVCVCRCIALIKLQTFRQVPDSSIEVLELEINNSYIQVIKILKNKEQTFWLQTEKIK